MVFTCFSWLLVFGDSATVFVTHALVKLVYSFGIATDRWLGIWVIGFFGR